MDKTFKKDFLKGSAAATIGTIAVMFFHFLSIMLLTRNLDKQEFGIYIILLVVANLFVTISGLGLNLTLVKFITGNNEHDNNAAFRAVMILRTAFLIITSALFLLLSNYILPLFNLKDTQFILYIPVLFFFLNFKDLLNNLLQGLRLYKKFAIVQTISAASRVLIIYIFLLINLLTLENLIFIEIGTTALAVFAQMFLVPFIRMLRVPPALKTYKTLFRFSIPIYLNNILTFSFDRVSIFLISIFLNPVSVALYDVASKIPEALQRIFVSFTIVFFPNQSKLFAEGKKEEALQLMNKSLHFFSFLLAFGVLISFLFHSELVVLLFSESYIESGFAFALLMLNVYLRLLSNIMGYSLVASGKPSAPVMVNSVTSAVNIGLSLLLIPIFGFIGAVYALLIMNIISQLIYHIYLVRSHLPPDGLSYLRPLVLVLFLLAPYYILGDYLFLKASLLLMYLVLSWYFVVEFRTIIQRIVTILKKRKIFSVT